MLPQGKICEHLSECKRESTDECFETEGGNGSHHETPAQIERPGRPLNQVTAPLSKLENGSVRESEQIDDKPSSNPNEQSAESQIRSKSYTVSISCSTDPTAVDNLMSLKYSMLDSRSFTDVKPNEPNFSQGDSPTSPVNSDFLQLDERDIDMSHDLPHEVYPAVPDKLQPTRENLFQDLNDLIDTHNLAPKSDFKVSPYLIPKPTLVAKLSNTATPALPPKPRTPPKLDIPAVPIPPKSCYPAILAKLSSHVSPIPPPKSTAPALSPKPGLPPKQDYHRFRALPDIPDGPDPFPSRNRTDSADSEQVYWEIEMRPPKTDYKNRPLPPPPILPPFGYQAPKRDFRTIPIDKSSKHDFPAGRLTKSDFLTMPANQSSSRHDFSAPFKNHPAKRSAFGHVYPVTAHNLNPRGHRPHKHGFPAVPDRPAKLECAKPNPPDSSSRLSVLTLPNLPPKPAKHDFLAVPDVPTLPDLPPRPAKSDIPASKPDIPPAKVDVLPELPPKPVSKPVFPELPSLPPKPVKPGANESSIPDRPDIAEPCIHHLLNVDKPDVPEPGIPSRPPKPDTLPVTEPSIPDRPPKPDTLPVTEPSIPDRPPKPDKIPVTEPSIPDRLNKPDRLLVPETCILSKGCHPLILDKPDVPESGIPTRPPKPDQLPVTEPSIPDRPNKPDKLLVPETCILSKGCHPLILDKPDVPESDIPIIPTRPPKPDQLPVTERSIPNCPNKLDVPIPDTKSVHPLPLG